MFHSWNKQYNRSINTSWLGDKIAPHKPPHKMWTNLHFALQIPAFVNFYES